MSKNKTQYRCSDCGHTQVKWVGKCPSCNSWNTFNEEEFLETSQTTIKNRASLRSGSYSNLSNKISSLSEIQGTDLSLMTTCTGIQGLDSLLSSTLNGGLVKGSITLIGGDPGIGKSTLLLQISSIFKKTGKKVIYFSGEESDNQIALRAKRLNIKEDILIANISELEEILNILDKEKPDFIVIDSVQTIYSNQLSSMAGSISQIKECVAAIAQKVKQYNIDTFIIGHVTKDGDIAGPQALSHMVDTVLYFEGESESNYRILRSNKNRYGSIDDIVIFEMTEYGLVEISDPSDIFLDSGYNDLGVGTVILSTIFNNKSTKNNTAMLVEVQSLLNESGGQYSNKVANGIEYNRLSIILGIIKKFTNIPLHKFDIFVSVVSGIKIIDSASDLAIFLSLLSNIHGKPIKSNTVVFGEISLNGNLRLPKNFEKRISVAEKIGFKNVIMPYIYDNKLLNKIKNNNPDIQIIMCKNVVEVNNFAFLD